MCLGPPLPILAGLAFLCELSACIIYGVERNETNISFENIAKNPVGELGWSYILVIIGTVAYFIDMILGIVVVKCGAI